LNDPHSTRRPHIVMVSGHAPPVLDGVGDHTALLLAELARQRPNWRWTLLTRKPGWWRSPLSFGAGYWIIRPNRTWSERGRQLACKVLCLLKPDLVHIQEQIHSFFETDAAPRLAKAANCPVVTTLHEYHIELPSVVYTDELVRHSSVLIANDARNAERCRERTGRIPERWWTGSPLSPVGKGERIATEADLVTTFGFLSSLKSFDPVLIALDRLRARGRPLRWRIVGPLHPKRNATHSRLAGLAAPGRLELTGAVSGYGSRLRALLTPSRVMLLPYADGASLRRSTLHAAWALGIPVITTRPLFHEPAIVDGENCLLVYEQTPAEWESALDRLLSDPTLEATLAAGSRKAAETFGWPALARHHLALYDRLLVGGEAADAMKVGGIFLHKSGLGEL
jgi:glycosyltransferase involved in cell wall biosynthesis